MNRPTQILIDECFLLCASRYGCDSTECAGEPDEKQRLALTALLLAFRDKIKLVVDQPAGQGVAQFYRRKHDKMSRDVRALIIEWLNGRGQRLAYYKPRRVSDKVRRECNLRKDELDLLLCGLALASAAPVWTLDSDFWCAAKQLSRIHPVCPDAALDSVR
jgi:hypothetical protein